MSELVIEVTAIAQARVGVPRLWCALGQSRTSSNRKLDKRMLRLAPPRDGKG